MKEKTKGIRRVRAMDKAATALITVGGISVILTVVAILVLIANQAAPLFKAPLKEAFKTIEAPAADQILDIGLDEYIESHFVLYKTGELKRFALDEAHTELSTTQIKPPAGATNLVSLACDRDFHYTALWDNASVSYHKVSYKPKFDAEGKRSIVQKLSTLATFEKVTVLPIKKLQVTVNEEGEQFLAALLNDQTIKLVKQTSEEDFLGNVSFNKQEATIPVEIDGRVTDMTLNLEATQLYLGNDQGEIVGWNITRPTKAKLIAKKKVAEKAITALRFIFGGESLAIGDVEGHVTTWGLIQGDEGYKEFVQQHELSRHEGPVKHLRNSLRNKSLLSLGEDGRLFYDHMTSERQLYDFGPEEKIKKASLSLRVNALIALVDSGEFKIWRLENDHPETNAKTLFGKVWYENYPEPEYVWQSSSASDDFEPKISLMPLIFGSLKGTLYAMLLSVPLALFGALYTSQFTTARVRGIIKPAVEVMAAIPSVVVGFLAALWFAPLLEKNLTGFFLTLGVLPVVTIISILIWQVLRKNKALRVVEMGYEFAILIPILIIGFIVAVQIGPWLESALFEGNLQLWMYEAEGIRYDPRNCIVIAFALGFAVIPIIFTISEDAFSNVPKNLTAASLAMGASRWQTVWRVVLPSASPGIFAGIVIGLGRAVGETMIVLMATGNTPIMDWSAFNGMRTLSANIAVEIPEAPVASTLYRVLFLSAVILFVMTFILNTVAELVRQHLREKYGRFQ